MKKIKERNNSGLKMKNTITDLNNYLFACLEGLHDDEMEEKDFEREVTKAKSTCMIAEKIIENNKTVIEARRISHEYNLDSDVLAIGDSHGES